MQLLGPSCVSGQTPVNYRGLQGEATKIINGCKVLVCKVKGQKYCTWRGGLKGCKECWAALIRFPSSGVWRDQVGEKHPDAAGQRSRRRASRGDLPCVGSGLRARGRPFCRERCRWRWGCAGLGGGCLGPACSGLPLCVAVAREGKEGLRLQHFPPY